MVPGLYASAYSVKAIKRLYHGRGGAFMEILEERSDNIVVLKLSGRLDATTAKDVKERVGEIIKNNNVNLVIDMGGVDFIDSSGLGVLVASLRSVNKVGGDIKIAALQDQVRAIFELTRLHRLFEIFDDSSTAVESF
jgi:anti-sigma B factor antagonist